MRKMQKRMVESDGLRSLTGYQVQMVNLLFSGTAREGLSGFDISPAKVTALLMIRDNPGCEQTPLGQALSINRSSTMKLVNVLEEKGLVERRPGRDLRSNSLFLTPHGEEQVARMTAALEQSDRLVMAPLSPSEQAQLHGLMAKLREGPRTRGKRPAGD
jgi:DNA-binding MarR family transcriptional regulator